MLGLTQTWINDAHLPLVLEPTDKKISLEESLQLIATNQQLIREQLLKCGGLLFRNFPFSNENHFASFIKTVNYGPFVDYIGGDSPRNKIKEGVYTSTEAPPSIKIPLHNELSFVKNHPSHIYFFCQIAPKEKGETTIADARAIYRHMDSAVKKRFHARGLKYTSCYFHKSKLMDLLNRFQRSHKSWLDVFETHSKVEVERKCIENDFEFKWHRDDWLQISQKRPAFIAHPITKEMIWFNQAHLYDFNPKLLGLWRYLGAKVLYMRKHMRLHEVAFGDGTPIPRADLYHILDTLEQNTIYFPWQAGDVLLLDNVLAMHGRATFTGRRRILAAMTG